MALTDIELIDELKERLDKKDQALYDHRVLTKNLKQLNTKLEESEKLKTDFISNLRNELNNPLTSILGLSRQLMDVTEVEKFRAVAEMINYESMSLDFQIRNIISAAELEAGEAMINYQNIDLVDMINDCIEGFAPLVEEKEIELDIIRAEGVTLKTDPDKLFMTLANLVSNAIVFNKQGGRVKIDVRKTDDELSVSVADTGMGIDESLHGVIFDRFKQLYTGSTKRFRGNGLGLSVAKAMGDLLGGKITLESTVGEGSKFTFTMPYIAAEEGEFMASEGVEFFMNGADVEGEEGEEEQEF